MSAAPSFLVRDLDDAELLRYVDLGSFQRGRRYFRDGHVVSVDDDGESVSGLVEGSGATYQTIVRRAEGRLLDRCSCPLTGRCKHVVALVMAARAGASGAGPAEVDVSAPTWEQALDRALGERAASAGAPRGTRRTALELVVHRPVVDATGESVTVSMQPLVEASRGGWVRSGVSWTELPQTQLVRPGARTPALHPDQLEALRAIGRAARPAHHGGYAYRQSQGVGLGDLGDAWPRLLRAAMAAGVTLLGDRDTEVRVLDETVSLEATVAPPVDGGPGSVTFGLDLPREPADARWRELRDAGQEVVGWVSAREHELVLVAAGTPLDPRRRRLASLGRLEVPAEEWSRFVLEHLPAVRRRVPTVEPESTRPQPPVLVLDVVHHPEHRSEVTTGFGYGLAGGSDLHLVPLADDAHPVRDRAAETELLQRVGPWLVDSVVGAVLAGRVEHAETRGLETAGLVRALGVLEADPGVLLRVQGEPATYAEAPEGPEISVSTSGGGGSPNDWFDLQVVVEVAGEQVPLPDLIAALAVGQDVMLLPSGTWFSLDRPELVRLASVLAEARMLQDREGPEQTGLRLTPLHAGLWQELVDLGVVAGQSSAWSEHVQVLLDLDRRQALEPPAGLEATLRDYQVEGFRWLASLWDAGLGGVLADDMGLGKTVQVLAVVQRAHERGELTDPVLIVCPTSVIGTWTREAERFAPGLAVRTLDATRRKSGVPLEEAIAGAQVVVTSFALLRIDAEEWQSRPWSALVLDEAQFVKNHRSKGYQSARLVPATRTYALTGTPLENSLMDLWSILSLAAPGLYPRPERFKEHYAVPIEKLGAVEELTTLRRRIRPLMVRRTKEAVATELPAKQEVVLHVPLAARHRMIYDRHLQRERQRLLGLVDDFDTHRFTILKALTTLRQLSLDPGLVDPAYAGLANPAKIDLLVEQLQSLRAEGHRALVFSQFTGFLAQVRERLDREGLTHCYLDGRTKRRDEVVQRFRDGDDVAFLISLKAGGFGLTLTEADYVVVLDPWWNPAAEMQAVDRTHRIGQDKQVFVYRLVSTDTIEEKVVELQQRKRDLFARVVDADGAPTGAITADDIRALLDL